MKKKKLRLKKKVKVILTCLVIIIVLSIVGINIYKDYKYKQTYEYKLSLLNYNTNEIALLKDNLSNTELDNLLLEEKKDSTLLSFLQNKFYKKENKERYYKYLENNDTSIEETINIVNINRDYDYYGISLKTDTSENYEMLVNKYYLLDKDYEPSDLVSISSDYAWGDEKFIRSDVYNAFIEMHNAALTKDYYLMINSAYRSYADQEEVYNSYKDDFGTDYADSIAARPGASEHQTGLALDIFEKNNSNSKTFKDTNCFKWLKNNSYKYGFILRYEEGKEDLTGYNAESWHYRYVGKDIAAKVYSLGITYDEYYANYLK